MAPESEKYLWDNISDERRPRDVISEMLNKGMIKNAKQAYVTLVKWSNQGKYTWGVSLDLGWKT